MAVTLQESKKAELPTTLLLTTYCVPTPELTAFTNLHTDLPNKVIERLQMSISFFHGSDLFSYSQGWNHVERWLEWAREWRPRKRGSCCSRTRILHGMVRQRHIWRGRLSRRYDRKSEFQSVHIKGHLNLIAVSILRSVARASCRVSPSRVYQCSLKRRRFSSRVAPISSAWTSTHLKLPGTRSKTSTGSVSTPIRIQKVTRMVLGMGE